MKIAILFPGQGSQFIGMGSEFIEADAACASLMDMAEATCQLGLRSLISEGSMEELTRGTNLQPAITVTNLICYQALNNALGDKLEVHCFAGHSLGEYSALCSAGVISPEDAIRLVSKRGALMEREGIKNPGGMRAVLGLDIGAVEQLIADYKGDGKVTVANHNTPAQIVISGSMDALDVVGSAAEELGAKVIALNVSVANHSPLVASAVPDFTQYMSDIEFKAPKTPIYFNVSGQKETDPAVMKEMMANQIASRVRWCEIIQAMLAEGIDTFIEVGPKTVLKGMMRKIVAKGTKVTALHIDSPGSLENCLEKLGGL